MHNRICITHNNSTEKLGKGLTVTYIKFLEISYHPIINIFMVPLFTPMQISCYLLVNICTYFNESLVCLCSL